MFKNFKKGKVLIMRYLKVLSIIIVVLLFIMPLNCSKGFTVKYKIHGLGYSPYIYEGQNPDLGTQISEPQIVRTIGVIAPYTNWIRTFGCTGNLANVGKISRGYGLKVAVGVWLSSDLSANEKEISSIVKIAKSGQADVVIVGSEVLLRGDLTEYQLIEYINRVKYSVNIPVATSDVWSVLLQHQAVLNAVDIVYANFYPYWEGTVINDAVSSLNSQYKLLKKATSKQIVIGETGWPSQGNTIGNAVASEQNSAFYFLNFVSWAKANDIQYFYFEAFDEEWKIKNEGPQGGHWGIWDKDMKMKPYMQYPFEGNTINDNWNNDTTIGGPGRPTISFTYIPSYGTFDNLVGNVLHVKPSECQVIVYIKVLDTWWVKPNSNSPVTNIQSNGNWVCDITTGGIDENATEITAFIVPINYTSSTFVPINEIESQAIAKVSTTRYDTSLPDLPLGDVTESGGKYWPVIMTLVKSDWQSTYWDLDTKNHPEIKYKYRYEIFEAKGAKGGEEFRLGLAIPPVCYYFKAGLTTEWQTIVLDISNRNPEYIYQVGFEYGPNWTHNKIGTSFSISNIRFSNRLPDGPYFLVDNHLEPPVRK